MNSESSEVTFLGFLLVFESLLLGSAAMPCLFAVYPLLFLVTHEVCTG